MRGYEPPPSYALAPATRASAKAVATAHGLREIAAWPIGLLGIHCIVYELPPGADRNATLERLRRDNRVEIGAAVPVVRDADERLGRRCGERSLPAAAAQSRHDGRRRRAPVVAWRRRARRDHRHRRRREPSRPRRARRQAGELRRRRQEHSSRSSWHSRRRRDRGGGEQQPGNRRRCARRPTLCDARLLARAAGRCRAPCAAR